MKKKLNHINTFFLNRISILWLQLPLIGKNTQVKHYPSPSGEGVRRTDEANGLFFLVIFFFFSSFSPDPTCISSVKKVFDQLSSSPESNNVSYLKYTVTAQLSQKDKTEKNITNTSTFELITTKGKSRMYSKEMVVLRDEQNTFTILPAKKEIYWTNTYVKEKPLDAYNNLKHMQDSLFKHTEKIDCKAVTGQTYNKTINLILDKKMAGMIQMKSITYFINDIKNLLKKVDVVYLPNNQFERVTYVFNDVNMDYKKADMNIPALKLVFEKDYILQKQYIAYKLIDTRKK